MEDKTILSTKNPIIKNIRLLQEKKSARDQQGLFIVEGIRAVSDLKHKKVQTFIATRNINKDAFCKEETQWIEVSENVFSFISDTKTPQGIMAVVYKEQYSLDKLKYKKNSIFLVVENVQDAGNLGTLIRTAYGFGVEAIFLSSSCVDLYNPKVVRATMGVELPIFTNINISDCIHQLKQKDITICVTDLQTDTYLQNCEFNKGVALVVGNEANGVTEQTKELADKKIKIQMQNNLESLNVSIASAICLYQICIGNC
ncbi:hypothetical protein AN639_00980 [Candidatus Epulonipiscium fishelsonii]|uniref:Uncharacterized protein n=1 Tax=Candidatus Epulonipiscium fishelsonii TaxID=77094 RepID=A0ACC8XCL7_9FIRM|nr:hypothetical protein AN396_06155 [Epulopiscium sp. SCG-B11WGA-EpuloA1]ONI41367.1 hypothetical protein AN639_00980 [Epulopiscium sp. SCG-B05WGA-EpuloA1]